MRRLVALTCAWSLVMVSPAALAVDSSPGDPRDRRVEEIGVRWTESTPLDEEVRRLGEERRQELENEMRSLAAIQLLRPTTSPYLWDLLGSTHGVDWELLGTFYLLEGETPPAKTGDQVPTRFVVGNVQLTSGQEVTNVVASVADIGDPFVQPAGSLLFLVHQVSEDPSQALAEAVRFSRQAERITAMALGETTSLPDAGLFEDGLGEMVDPSQAWGALTAQEACLNSCSQVRLQERQECAINALICAGAATAGAAICVAACTVGAALTCTPACLAVYGVAISACNAVLLSCYHGADQRFNICNETCRNTPNPTPAEIPCIDCGSPIVINLDGRQGFRFTDTASGVLFDLDADGVEDQAAWTEPGYAQAFLALDRNGNGTIDDGGELFGDVTVQDSSARPNGYLALQLFDQVALGGNNDGLMGPADAVFDLLKLWVDDNQDGVSQPGELSSLRDAGIEHIDLNYVVSNRRDRHGNLLRYKSLVQTGNRVVESTDVFFLVEPAEGSGN